MVLRRSRGIRRLAGLAGLILCSALAPVLPAGSASAATVGASTPFTSYEAESGVLAGGATVVSLTSAPTTQYSSPQLEASGHAYVQLTGTGQSVTWTNTTGQPVSFVNVRLSIPDAPNGGGTTSSLNLYVNGSFRQALPVNSRQTWMYEGNNYNQSDQNPSALDPRVFFDDTHAFVSGSAIPAGGTITLQKDSANSAANYLIDVIDVENPPAPLAQPANSLSITSCGAVADNTPTNGAADPQSLDSTAAIQNCINQAQSQNKVLWIPAGTFYLKGTTGLQAQGITIAGAGMWYSAIYRAVPLPNSVPLAAAFSVTSSTLENFLIDTDAMSRTMVDGGGGAMDTNGTNWVATGMWVQHAESGMWAAGTGGKVSNSRFTSIYADGINLNNVSNGSSVGDHLTATNNFVRGTGDDGMAINSVNYNDNGGTRTYYTAMSNVTMTNNTVIGAWGGKGIGIYGGGGHVVDNNYISDTARYIGLGVGKFGVNGSDLTSATVSGNMVVRSGGNGYNQGQPALQIGNGGDGQSTGNVSNATVTGNTIVNAMYDGIGFSTTNNANVANNTITSPWRNGIVIQPPFYPAPSGSATISGNTVTGLRSGMSPYVNNSGGFTATVSGNSWQSASAVVGASPSSLNFASSAVGTSSAAQSVTVSNTGSAAASISNIATTVGFGQTNNCGSSLAAGASCSVNVAFTPTASGTTTGALSVSGSNPVSVSLSGTVSTSGGGGSTNLSTGAAMTANSTQQSYVASNANDGNTSTYWEGVGTYPQWLRVDFGSVKSVTSVTITVPPASSWATRTQTLSVEGSADGTTWTTLVASADRVFNPSTGNAVTITLPASSTARYVRLSFTGNTGATGGQASEFQVFGGTTAGGGSANVSASPTSLSFPATNVGTASSQQNVTLANSGTAAASVSGVSVSGDFSQTNTCGTGIAMGASCTVSVTFRPTANGSRTGTLTVAGSNPVSVSLSGTGNTVTGTGNLAAGKSMSSSGYTQTYAPANANDGNQATYWEGTANAYPNWLQVDLGSSQTVGRVVLKLPTTWGARTQTFSVQGSTTGSTWTTLMASATYAYTPSANTVTITFTGASERYVRVNFTANTGATGGQVSELEVYSS